MIRKILSKIYNGLQMYVFGNRIGIFKNLSHQVYYFFVRLFFVIKGGPDFKPSAVSRELKENGYTSFSPSIDENKVDSLRRQAENAFEDPEKRIETYKKNGMIRLKDSLVNVSTLDLVLKDRKVIDAIRSYFGSNFSIHNADIYRTFPKGFEETDTALDSLFWHFDNAPKTNLKLFVYLNDTTVENGALSLVPKKISNRLKSQGGWKRRSMPDHCKKIADEKHIRIEGKALTCILFTPQFVLHKAVLPVKNHRDAAVFLIYPSISPPPELTEETRIQLGRKFGYMTNPFTRSPQRIGIE